MSRRSYSGYLFIIALLLVLISLSAMTVERFQGMTIAALSPLWERISSVTQWAHPTPAYAEGTSVPDVDGHTRPHTDEQIRRLELDNQLLSMQLKTLQQQLLHEIQLHAALAKEAQLTPETRAHVQQHFVDTKRVLNLRLDAIPARVISRSPSSWNSSLWIGVGEEDNASLGRPVIAKNSPVLLGASVVGVVEYIGKRQSRVRLITDAGLNPSVCNVRGGQHALLLDYMDTLIGALEKQGPVLIHNDAKKEAYLTVMKGLKDAIGRDAGAVTYLAKGELHGSSYPLWRKRGNMLKGVGFNCDVADAIGPARDLRTGQVANQPSSVPMALLKVGDLLVTTGMDGVFPPGLPVAEVTKVNILKEGDYTYELEAKPTAGNLEELSLVFVIPPVTGS